MHDGVPGGLSGAVLVVVVVLGFGVVHRHHGAGEDPGPLSGVETVDAGGGLLTAAQEPVAVGGTLAAEQADQVAAVVHDQVGAALQALCQQILIALHIHPVDAKGLHPQLRHGGGHVVLGGEGVAAGEIDLRAALPKNQAKVGGLGLQMDGDSDGQPGEGLFTAEAVLNAAEGGHEIPHPLDLLTARRGQGHILDDAHVVSSLFYLAAAGSGQSEFIPSYCITIPSKGKEMFTLSSWTFSRKTGTMLFV